uniref:Uncharacterized protein n=1 Tax=Ralstonia solanacearum TaxID=305 RepID=A0A0S4XK87_RALSL|nr:protein of unknown function [Ralstonia solanacearum]
MDGEWWGILAEFGGGGDTGHYCACWAGVFGCGCGANAYSGRSWDSEERQWYSARGYKRNQKQLRWDTRHHWKCAGFV